MRTGSLHRTDKTDMAKIEKKSLIGAARTDKSKKMLTDIPEGTERDLPEFPDYSITTDGDLYSHKYDKRRKLSPYQPTISNIVRNRTWRNATL